MEIDEPLKITLGDGKVATVGQLVKYYSSTNKKWMPSIITHIAAESSQGMRYPNGYSQPGEHYVKTGMKVWLGKNVRYMKDREFWYHSGTITFHDFKNIRSWDGV